MDKETADRIVEDWERTTDRLVELEDENKGLRWLVAMFLRRNGNVAHFTVMDIATVESDDVLTMEQNADKTWTVRRVSALDEEGAEFVDPKSTDPYEGLTQREALEILGYGGDGG